MGRAGIGKREIIAFFVLPVDESRENQENDEKNKEVDEDSQRGHIA